MKFLMILLLLSVIPLFSQINAEDSTVQVITYMNKGDIQTYKIAKQKIKLIGLDTLSNSSATHTVEISVIDSTDKSYILQWYYKNIEFNSANDSINKQNEFLQKLLKLTENMRIIFKTDEMGIFLELLNWNEISEFIEKTVKLMKKEFNSIPNMDTILDEIVKSFLSKESIEANSINEIVQFHNFYGVQLKLGEKFENKIKLSNLLGGDSLDADYELYLDEIDNEELNYMVRSTTLVDPNQLANETLKYISKLLKDTDTPLPTKEELGDLYNETYLTSVIDNSGWLLYSIQTVYAYTGDAQEIEETIIQIQ